MKKLVALTALASVFSYTAEADLNGLHAGGILSYARTSAHQHIKGARDTKTNFTGGNVGATAELKFIKTTCNQYMGADVRLGYNFGSFKKGGDKIENGLNAGIGGRIGTFLNKDTVAFFRLGFNVMAQRFSYEFNGLRYKDHYKVFEAAPGVGIAKEMGNSSHMEFMYEYGMAYSTSGENGAQHTYTNNPRSHRFSVGYSVKI